MRPKQREILPQTFHRIISGLLSTVYRLFFISFVDFVSLIFGSRSGLWVVVDILTLLKFLPFQIWQTNRQTDEQISDKIAEIVTPDGLDIEVKVIYQTVTDLHKACPNNTGDWYFTVNYPTVGGTRVVNRSFINYMENNDNRAYWFLSSCLSLIKN